MTDSSALVKGWAPESEGAGAVPQRRVPASKNQGLKFPVAMKRSFLASSCHQNAPTPTIARRSWQMTFFPVTTQPFQSGPLCRILWYAKIVDATTVSLSVKLCGYRLASFARMITAWRAAMPAGGKRSLPGRQRLRKCRTLSIALLVVI